MLSNRNFDGQTVGNDSRCFSDGESIVCFGEEDIKFKEDGKIMIKRIQHQIINRHRRNCLRTITN